MDITEHFEDLAVLVVPVDGDDLYVVGLSGTASVAVSGAAGQDWHRTSVDMYIPLAKAFAAVVARGSLSSQPPDSLGLRIVQSMPLVTPIGFSDEARAVNMGIAVNGFRVVDPGGLTQHLHVVVDVAVRDIDAEIHRLGFMIMLVGNVWQIER